MLELHRRQRARDDSDDSVDLLSWTMLHRRQLIPERLFDLTRRRYLVDIYNETARRVLLYKSSQMGASEYLVSYALHAADCRLATVLYVFPTDTHVSDFSSARIGPALEASPYLSDIVVEGKDATGVQKRGADRVTLKRVRDRFLYMRGARVDKSGRAPQLKSIDADILILDEIDEMDPRAPSIAQKRLNDSEIAEERWVSTPTYPGYGIHAAWQLSDQREWVIKCSHCGKWQTMTIGRVVIEWDQLGRPVAWHGQKQGGAHVACRKCKRELDRDAPGRWVARNREVETVGFHLTRFMNPAADILDIVQSLQSLDETKRKETFNQDLGEPYTPRGGQLTDVELDVCRREYAHGPVHKEATTMGVDVGKVMHCVIRGALNEHGETPQRLAVAADSFDEVGRLALRYGVTRAVIDALPETTKARELQAAFPGVVWLAYYNTQRVGSKLVEPYDWDWKNGVVTMDRTRTLDALFARFVAGSHTLPADARSVPDYYEHLKAPVRVLEDGPGGTRVAIYIESGADHFAHSENYCLAAAGAPEKAKEDTPTVTAPAHVVRREDIFD